MLDHNLSIIFDPRGSARDFAMGVHEYVIGKVDDPDQIELNPLDVRYFRNGEYNPKITRTVTGRDCVLIHNSNLEPSIWNTQLALINQALRGSSPHYVINVIPNALWGRQDMKNESRVPISAKEVLRSMNHDHTRIITVEDHNLTRQGYVDVPFDILPAFPVLYRHIKDNHPDIQLDNLIFAGPDSGCLKRNRKYTKEIGMTAVQVDKDRTITGELGKSLGVLGADLVKGNDVLLYDDMWDSGGSLRSGALALKNVGARKVLGAVPHALCLEGLTDTLEYFDLFFIGDTMSQPLVPGEGVYLNKYARQALPREIKESLPQTEPVFFSDILRQFPPYKDFQLPEKVEIFSLIPTIGKAVHRWCVGESLSALFNLSQENTP